MSAVSILLVDDDDIDVQVVRRAFSKRDLTNPIVVANDGIEALEIMRGENGNDKIADPYLVLLDINMPRMNGFEFLDEIRQDPDLRKTVVFMLTTSSDDADMLRASERNIAGYLVKGDAGDAFLDTSQLLDVYWKLSDQPANTGDGALG